MNFNSKLREIMDTPPKIKGSDFSKLTGISSSMISDIRNGRRVPSWEKLNIIIKFLNILDFEKNKLIELWKKEQDSNYIEEKEVILEEESVITLSVLGKASAGRGYMNFNSSNEHRTFIPTNNIKYENCFIVRVDGDSMEPEILDNSDLVIEPSLRNIQEHVNKIVLATVNGETYVKTLKKLNNKLFLESFNKNYSDIEISKNDEFSIIGRAIEVRYTKTLK
ncbi:MAG: XRE family transcriptional regulator [Fusobacteriaceae bacterium]